MVVASPPPEHRGGGRGLRIAGLATAGAGVLLAGTGVAFGFSARSASRDIDEVSAGGGTWSDEHQQIYDRGERHETLALAFGITGAAAVATGTVLYFIGRSRAKVSLALGDSSAGFRVSAWF